MLCAKYALNHTREARARARARARSASFPLIVRAYCLRECWRAERPDRQKNNLSQNIKLGAPKRVSASAHVGSARDRRLITMSATGDDAHVAPLEGCARG